jgi:hypothetical protein
MHESHATHRSVPISLANHCGAPELRSSPVKFHPATATNTRRDIIDRVQKNLNVAEVARPARAGRANLVRSYRGADQVPAVPTAANASDSRVMSAHDPSAA